VEIEKREGLMANLPCVDTATSQNDEKTKEADRGWAAGRWPGRGAKSRVRQWIRCSPHLGLWWHTERDRQQQVDGVGDNYGGGGGELGREKRSGWALGGGSEGVIEAHD
jgi:hypothetical protein